jgi:short-subunit dehydrogenase
MTVDQIEQQIHVNVLGTMLLTKAMLPAIKEAKGRL